MEIHGGDQKSRRLCKNHLKTVLKWRGAKERNAEISIRSSLSPSLSLSLSLLFSLLPRQIAPRLSNKFRLWRDCLTGTALIKRNFISPLRRSAGCVLKLERPNSNALSLIVSYERVTIRVKYASISISILHCSTHANGKLIHRFNRIYNIIMEYNFNAI